jgi:hypothetical protein
MSSWSPIVNIGFPDEFVADMPVMRIIEINNEDAENYRFRNILLNEGVIQHVSNEIMDQDIKYFHQPENIPSGFYTDERRIIPLKDKLESMDSDIRTIMDEIYALDPSVLEVSVSDQNYGVALKPYTTSSFNAPAWSDTVNSRDVNNNAVDIVMLRIYNPTKHNVKLFSMFPGNTKSNVRTNTPSRFSPSNYYSDDGSKKLGVFGYSDNTDNFSDNTDNFNDDDISAAKLFTQHQNQMIYFRLDSPYDGNMYYKDFSIDGTASDLLKTNNVLCGGYNGSITDSINLPQYIRKTGPEPGATLCMNITGLDSICITGGDRFKVLGPGESITIPLEFIYNLDQNAENPVTHIEKTLSFDIWTSLFGDPANYTVTIAADYIDDISKKNRNNLIGTTQLIHSLGHAYVPQVL